MRRSRANRPSGAFGEGLLAVLGLVLAGPALADSPGDPRLAAVVDQFTARFVQRLAAESKKGEIYFATSYDDAKPRLTPDGEAICRELAASAFRLNETLGKASGATCQDGKGGWVLLADQP